MSAVCPAGHTSTAEDYCDVCGMPIDSAADAGGAAAPGASPVAPGAGTPGGQPCPNCSTPNGPDALFCENCGYDFTTGAMPRPLTPPDALVPPQALTPPDALPPPSPVSDAPEVPPSAATPVPTPDQGAAGPAAASSSAGFDWVAEVWIDPAWYQAQESPDPLPSAGLPDVVALPGPSSLIGRVSQSRNIHPEIDCGTDSGVSRRQSQLTTDGSRWWVEDLESANGTFVGPSSGALPEDPIAVGAKHELAANDRIYVGAWTRIVIRPATDDEKSSLG